MNTVGGCQFVVALPMSADTIRQSIEVRITTNLTIPNPRVRVDRWHRRDALTTP